MNGKIQATPATMNIVPIIKGFFIHSPLKIFGVPKGIRTPVTRMKTLCPNRARRWGRDGEPRRDRTCDPQLKRLLLYRLS